MDRTGARARVDLDFGPGEAVGDVSIGLNEWSLSLPSGQILLIGIIAVLFIFYVQRKG